LVAEVKAAISPLPSHGYHRTYALVCRQRVQQGFSAINLKRIYRVMRAHRLLLASPLRPTRPVRRHDGRVARLQELGTVPMQDIRNYAKHIR
jgi:putative transposase